MARNRVIYQSEALYVSEDASLIASGKHKQLDRVQSANYNFTVNKQDINQYGNLARIDSIGIEPPVVNLDFSYYLTDGTNERALGFYLQTGTGASEANFASGHMTFTSGKNFYITTSKEGIDYNSNTTNTNVMGIIGFGNAYLSNYTLEAAVGSIPTVSVSVEAANVIATGSTGGMTSISIPSPAINLSDGSAYAATVTLPSGSPNTGTSTISALRPGDITLSFTTGLQTGLVSAISGDNSMHIQSATLSLPLSRTPLQRLGNKYPFSRAVDFPVVATLSVNAVVNEASILNLSNAFDNNYRGDITLVIKKPNTTGSENAVVYKMKNAKVDSESFSSSIGANKSVDIVFSTQIGGINDTVNGVFVSGNSSTSIFQ